MLKLHKTVALRYRLCYRYINIHLTLCYRYLNNFKCNCDKLHVDESK